MSSKRSNDNNNSDPEKQNQNISETFTVAEPKEIWYQPLKAATANYHNLSSKLKKLAPYLSTDIYSEEKTSLHNQTRFIKALIQADSKDDPDYNLITKFISSTFKDKLNENLEIKSFFVRLANSDPRKMYDISTYWSPNGMRDNSIARMWISSYLSFGAPWKSKQKFMLDLSNKQFIEDENNPSPTKKARVPQVSFSTNTPIPQKPANLYLVKGLKTLPSPTASKHKHKHKFTTYIKIKTKPIAGTTRIEMEKDYSDSLSLIFKEMWKIDNSIQILPWNEISSAKPITRNSTMSTNRHKIEHYVDRMWLSPHQAAWPRLKIIHNINQNDLFTEELQDITFNLDMIVKKEQIQSKNTVKAGFLLGSIPDCCHQKDLETTLLQHPIMQGIELELRVELARVTQGKIQSDERMSMPKAIHLYCAYDKAHKCRMLLNSLYGSKNQSGYPQGRKMVFVPNIFDKRFPSTARATMKFKNAVFLQKNYLDKVKVTYFDGVVGLDFPITLGSPPQKLSLRQVIMAAYSNSGKRLFIGVEEDRFLKIKLAHHSNDEEEVTAFLHAMPLIFAHNWDKATWHWFSSDVQERLHGFSWTPTTGLTSSSDQFVEYVDDFSKYEHLDESDNDSFGSDDDQEGKAADFSFSFDLSIITGDDKDELINDSGSRISFTSCANKEMLKDNAEDIESASVNSSLTSTTTEKKSAIMSLLDNNPELQQEMLTMLHGLNLNNQAKSPPPIPADPMDITTASSTIPIDQMNTSPTAPSKAEETKSTPPKEQDPTGGNHG